MYCTCHVYWFKFRSYPYGYAEKKKKNRVYFLAQPDSCVNNNAECRQKSDHEMHCDKMGLM